MKYKIYRLEYDKSFCADYIISENEMIVLVRSIHSSEVDWDQPEDIKWSKWRTINDTSQRQQWDNNLVLTYTDLLIHADSHSKMNKTNYDLYELESEIIDEKEIFLMML